MHTKQSGNRVVSLIVALVQREFTYLAKQQPAMSVSEGLPIVVLCGSLRPAGNNRACFLKLTELE